MRNNLIFSVLMTLCLSNVHHVMGQCRSSKNSSISEDTEWSHIWMVSTRNHDLPRVLMIGDSHVERYYPGVADNLSNKAYCCKFTTSRSLGDPALIQQLKTLFFSYRFDVIIFNNGLHGVGYSNEQYSNYIPIVYKVFKKSNLGLKLIWVNTTARRVSGNISDFDQLNAEVINRNKAVEKFTRDKKIPLIDFYSLSSKHSEYYENDGIHFNPKGVEEQANAVSNSILSVLNPGSK